MPSQPRKIASMAAASLDFGGAISSSELRTVLRTLRSSRQPFQEVPIPKRTSPNAIQPGAPISAFPPDSSASEGFDGIYIYPHLLTYVKVTAPGSPCGEIVRHSNALELSERHVYVRHVFASAVRIGTHYYRRCLAYRVLTANPTCDSATPNTTESSNDKLMPPRIRIQANQRLRRRSREATGLRASPIGPPPPPSVSGTS